MGLWLLLFPKLGIGEVRAYHNVKNHNQRYLHGEVKYASGHVERNQMKRSYKPGEIAQESGQYTLYNRLGHSERVQTTVVRGEPIPPTPKKDMRYVLTDKTKH
ncbi:hypothetical protein A2716_03990 [candidate division WWE3 bacterium RIFCSPHIGHO2_01_FULL_40_23]|uniref:Uncharacterized protein n=1 Tax=candidate division WWE3 bacterium RIFCSPLOWO2_01_FULL_41_18 TaxID=1802625 RepID=A0A1F4VD22_UNCKA|nr:MAG: hypothetical protein A2716_03990 [candidate division WWE3 bacterium RIFCSPHIGHO2_01_FULL_40_23]OGC55037.1 MAG: hypothetical protein A3A78_03600 [candidate division WWE3 bacterium RIFCSPLOWO2_01_FULL_41_18]